VDIHPVGIDIKRLPLQEQCLEPDQKATVLFCGRFTEKKEVDLRATSPDTGGIGMSPY